ncbi:MAG: hypothetical protein JW773_05220 [Desulfuromonadales bacterium]|nr:hypothetical protein [Desulfuromonadales bacterium]
MPKITLLLTCLTRLLVAMSSAVGGQFGMALAFVTGRNPQSAAVAATFARPVCMLGNMLHLATGPGTIDMTKADA